jgi:hypothetical protein
LVAQLDDAAGEALFIGSVNSMLSLGDVTAYSIEPAKGVLIEAILSKEASGCTRSWSQPYVAKLKRDAGARQYDYAKESS